MRNWEFFRAPVGGIVWSMRDCVSSSSHAGLGKAEGIMVILFDTAIARICNSD
jgi:hypothetical protein